MSKKYFNIILLLSLCLALYVQAEITCTAEETIINERKAKCVSSC